MESKTDFEKTMDKVLFYAIAVSAFFLLLILVLYMISPEAKDLQAKCTMSSCLSLFFGFVCITINASDLVGLLSQEYCIALAIASQFFMLSFYFWLNVMCFEISRIMRGTLNLKTYKEMTKSESRYFVYCIYSWGGPLLICLVTIVMQYLPRNLPDEVERYLIRPEIGRGRCWFKESGGATYAYYYGMEIFFHVLNVILMGHTTYLLHKEEVLICCRRNDNDTFSLRPRAHTSRNYLSIFKQQFAIFILYLFIWTLNTISLTNPRSGFWRVIDVIVGLQGVFLFIIVIRPKKYKLIRIAADRMSSLVKSLSKRSKHLLVVSVSEPSNNTPNGETRF